MDMKIIEDRRALHRIPELDRDLPETMNYLENSLKGLKCAVFSPTEGSLCAFFDFGRDEAIAFRADADALPITEKSGVPYASAHPGKMHACGHDGHMAILLELARRLSDKADLPHNVLLVFQPAEETTGGAKELCETGLFTEYRVKAIFGLHLWPGLPAGAVCSREQELMSRSCEVNVDFYGKSAHIAKADQGIDALAAAVEFYTRAAAMEKALPAHIFRLLKFGKLHSGTARNALSDHTHMEGSLRAFQDEVFFGMRDSLLSIAGEIEKATGCRVQVHMNDGYPAVMNPGDLYRKVRETVAFETLAEPSMTAEDFSWYQRYLPGMFFFLGLGDTPALHADNFDFDETILVKGADFFEELAEKFQ
ncbi:MAG: amidohydrolase [Oscillospiraceae bacterium]|nr:amidohydrolase [Oscillospiraceae bacterium]